MSDESPVSLVRGLPETRLPDPPADWTAELASALEMPIEQRLAAVGAVAAAHPRMSEAWATLSELARDDVEAYAYARVGYHRGLDALRGAGWHGTGYVRWREPSNRGFLRCLDSLRRASAAIGETDEEQRCSHFLRQLDPDWR